MKMLSKILSGAMVMALAAGMSITAFAAQGSTDYENLEQPQQSKQIVTVNATVEELGTVYSVNVAWTDLAFSYSETTPASWDKEQHKTIDSVGTWTNQGNGSVTVTNHSNADVYAKIAYAEDVNYQTDVANKGVTVTTTQVADATKLNAGDNENTTPQLTGDHQNQIQATVSVTGAPTADLSEVTAGTFTTVVGTNASLEG